MEKSKSLFKRVEEVFMDCLFRDMAETKKFEPVLSEGIVTNVGFHPERLASSKDKVKELIKEIVQDQFYKDSGGGYSFLSLPMDMKGEQWGEHKNAEQLFLLAQALKLASFCAPREMWFMLPGGMPYIVFER